MTDDRWLSWQAEQAGTGRGPSVAGVFARLLLVLVVLVALGALGPAQAYAERVSREHPTLCDEHAGRPGWGAVCPTKTSERR